MALFTDALRGDGLMRVHAALAAIEEDPHQADDTASRFDGPPPPYTSDRSGTATRSQGPTPPTDEQQSIDQRRDQLIQERLASRANAQFSKQKMEEEKRLWDDGTWRSYPDRGRKIPSQLADDIVKQRWVEQGIWREKWTSTGIGRWKHEELLEVESDWETDPEAPPPDWLSRQPKARRLKSEHVRRRIAEQRAACERERDASRPYYQFIYQMSRERERIQKEAIREGQGEQFAYDINTQAYENVKNIWRKRQIWIENWGVMPGMWWKHEQTYTEALRELGVALTPGDLRFAAETDQQYLIARQMSPLRLTDQAVVNESVPLPIVRNSSHIGISGRQAPNTAKIFRRGLFSNIDEDMGVIGLPDGRAEAHVPLPESPQGESSQVGRRSRARGVSSSQGPSVRNGSPTQSLSDQSLGPIRPSKISNPSVRKKTTSQQQARLSPEGLRDNRILSPAQDVPVNQPRRRSARLQLLEADQENGVLEAAPRTRQRKAMTDTSQPKASAKPKGVTKGKKTRKTTKKKS